MFKLDYINITMSKPKYSNETLMKFVDSELNDSAMAMQILSDVIDGDKKLEARLDVYVKTREVLTKDGNTLLLNILNQEKSWNHLNYSLEHLVF